MTIGRRVMPISNAGMNRRLNQALAVCLLASYAAVPIVGGHACAPLGILLFVGSHDSELFTSAIFGWFGVAFAVVSCFVRDRFSYVACTCGTLLFLVMSFALIWRSSFGTAWSAYGLAWI